MKTEIAISRIATQAPTSVLALRTTPEWRGHAEGLLAYAEPVSRVGLYVSLAIIYAWFGGMKFTKSPPGSSDRYASVEKNAERRTGISSAASTFSSPVASVSQQRARLRL